MTEESRQYLTKVVEVLVAIAFADLVNLHTVKPHEPKAPGQSDRAEG